MAGSLCGALLLACGGLAATSTAPGQHVSPITATSDPHSASPAPRATEAFAQDPTSITGSHEPPPTFHELAKRAFAMREHAAPAVTVTLPPGLQSLNYQGYRGIRFRPERSLWRGEPGRFEAQFFHLGFYYREPVSVAVVPLAGGEPEHLRFSADMFTYEGVSAPPADADLGFAGLRLHTPINSDGYRDEVAVFQGASYFRVVGRGQAHGLSARALAIDTGEPRVEEFPRFAELFLVRPGPNDPHVWVLGLLESARVTGAFAFRIEPGTSARSETLVEVTARVYPRTHAGKIDVLGLATLTSMYLFGEDAPARFSDYRPEVHDSDGMVAQSAAGEWIFRPLRNPPRTTTSEFRLDSPLGFGLVQRDRDFASYQDLESRYQDRPSIWIEPLGDWGKGSLRLLEIATELETDDNIALLWVPDSVPADGLAIGYRMHVGFADRHGPSGRVLATRRTATARGERFVIDFALDTPERALSEISTVVTAVGGKIEGQRIEANPFGKGARVTFDVVPDKGVRDVELRAFLREGDHVLTETFSYLFQPVPGPVSAAVRNR
jgi:glucans biosynthesis protein